MHRVDEWPVRISVEKQVFANLSVYRPRAVTFDCHLVAAFIVRTSRSTRMATFGLFGCIRILIHEGLDVVERFYYNPSAYRRYTK